MIKARSAEPSVNITLVSDIHLEHLPDSVTIIDFVGNVKSPYLVIAGDLGWPTKPNYVNFISQASGLYSKVFVVTGNHEYYADNPVRKNTMSQIDRLITEICEKFPNVYFLNNQSSHLDSNTVILGMTMWSDIRPDEEYAVENTINDYNYVYVGGSYYRSVVTANMIKQIHLSSVKWLKAQLVIHSDKNVIIVTHHMPTYQLIAEQYADSGLNSSYATNLEYVMESNPNIIGWLCGHTHTANSVKINNCQCVTNPVGYTHEKNTSFRDKIIQLDKYFPSSL